MKMISSTAFPKVTFMRAPIVSPSRLATLSVAWLRRPARGMIAIAFIAKTMPADAPLKLTAMPTGTKTSRILKILEKRISLTVRKNRMPTFMFFRAALRPNRGATWAGSSGAGSLAAAAAAAPAVAVAGGTAPFWDLLGVRRASAIRGDGPWAFVLAQVRMRSSGPVLVRCDVVNGGSPCFLVECRHRQEDYRLGTKRNATVGGLEKETHASNGDAKETWSRRVGLGFQRQEFYTRGRTRKNGGYRIPRSRDGQDLNPISQIQSGNGSCDSIVMLRGGQTRIQQKQRITRLSCRPKDSRSQICIIASPPRKKDCLRRRIQ